MNSTPSISNSLITEKQWKHYEEEGYVNLGQLLSDEELQSLQQRIDDIMLGKAAVDYDHMMMQLDSASGKYEEAGQQTAGFKGATKNYRKIEQLEHDALFLSYMQRPVYRDICSRIYGKDVSISCFRAMFMNKPAQKGTWLPWHQDRWNFLDRDPLLTVYTGLDPATTANGCVLIIPRSHKLGVINPEHSSGFLTKEQAEKHCPKEKIVPMELKPGEVALLHNWLLHASDVNKTDTSRRAFSVCCMDGRTRNMNTDKTYSILFGKDALVPEKLQLVAA